MQREHAHATLHGTEMQTVEHAPLATPEPHVNSPMPETATPTEPWMQREHAHATLHGTEMQTVEHVPMDTWTTVEVVSLLPDQRENHKDWELMP